MRLTSILKDIRYLLLGLLPLFFSAGILFLNDPLVWPDEAIYVDMAKNWLTTGVLKTSLFGDAVYGLQTIAAWYPPLYFYVLGFWIKLFGVSIESVRLLSLLVAANSLIAIYFLAKKLFSSRNLALLTVLLVSSDYFFSRSSRIARMDMFNFLLLSLSYGALFFQNSISLKRLLVAGILSGLALISHPLGLIGPAVIAGWLVIISPKIAEKMKRLAVFLLPVIFIAGGWLFSLRNYWDILLKQWILQIDRKNQSITYIFNLWQGQDFGWRVLFILYILALLFLATTLLIKKSKSGLFIFLGFIISSAMLIYGKEMFYPLYFQPFVSLMLVSLYFWVKHNQPKLLLYPGLLIGLVFFLNCHFFIQTVNIYTANNQNYYQYGDAIKNQLPGKATVYLSALPDPYFVLQEKPGLTLLEFPTMFTTDDQYYGLLDKADYLVYNQVFDTRLELYLQKNQLSFQPLNKAGNYDIMLSKLKPKDKRQWPGK